MEKRVCFVFFFNIVTMWILGLQLRSSALATSDFTSWTILLTPQIWNASLIPMLSLNSVFSLFSRFDNCFIVFRFATLSFCCQAWSHNDFVCSSVDLCFICCDCNFYNLSYCQYLGQLKVICWLILLLRMGYIFFFLYILSSFCF